MFVLKFKGIKKTWLLKVLKKKTYLKYIHIFVQLLQRLEVLLYTLKTVP